MADRKMRSVAKTFSWRLIIFIYWVVLENGAILVQSENGFFASGIGVNQRRRANLYSATPGQPLMKGASQLYESPSNCIREAKSPSSYDAPMGCFFVSQICHELSIIVEVFLSIVKVVPPPVSIPLPGKLPMHSCVFVIIVQHML